MQVINTEPDKSLFIAAMNHVSFITMHVYSEARPDTDLIKDPI